MVLVSSTSAAAKDWRGILPLHSTREDVEAALRPPPPPPKDRHYTLNKGRSIYFLDEGEVYIVFTDQDSLAQSNCESTVPPGVVSVIRVTPNTDVLVSDLNLDEKSFTKFDASDQGHKGFIDEKEGLVIRAFEGKVQEMVYIASASDRKRCPAFYDDLEGLVRTKIACALRFDEYGDIRFSDEKARLDNFSIQLENEQDARGYIIVYAGRKATVAEAQLRGNRARDYLISVRKISPERVTAMDGGHHEKLSVELHIAPAGAGPPPLMPTIEPSKVEIIYEKKRRSRRKDD